MNSQNKNFIIFFAMLSSCSFSFNEPGYVNNAPTVNNNISIPRETTKVTRAATPSEIALAEKNAARQLANADKSLIRILVENVGSSCKDTMSLIKECSWDTQPFGIEHGGKAIVLIATCCALYYVYHKCNESSDAQPAPRIKYKEPEL